MSPALRVLTADGMRDPKGDANEFMRSIVEAVNHAWAKKGVSGVDIVSAEWDGARGYIFLETIPGAQSLTVGRVSEHLKAERAKVAERWANGARALL
ncbi:hypothetical protein [Aureimonas sp. SK2]|uniref:hypothetical protein n=1 Tax=Aureimonas sp. SK2 TaxID=3015992 RepID=UPI0024451252|nr:hypothetical protein [Aureimonas sp. SK2]